MRKSLVTLAASSLVTTAAVVGATPAGAAANCSSPTTVVSSTISPRTVVVGVSAFKGIEMTVKVRSNGCAVDRVEMGLYGPNFVDSYDLERGATSKGVTTYQKGLRITPGSLPSSEAGRWRSFISVWGKHNPNVAGPDFRILRAAHVKANAAPEPVKKGRQITVTGSLTRADWDTLTNRGYAGRKVQLQWRTSKGTFRTVKTVTSGRSGALRATVKATKDGCFRFSFKGSPTTGAAASAQDCVDVR